MALKTLLTAGVLLATSCGATAADPGSGSSPNPPAVRTPTTLEPPSPAPGCPAFSLTLVSTRGGQPTPLAAVQWFQRNGNVGVDLPSSGWREDGRDATGVLARSGRAVLHVLRGPDGTWRVDSGRAC